MKRAYKHRALAEREALMKSIIRVTKAQPELSPALIAALLDCSHVTVRLVQRAAGIYRARGAAGVLLK